MHKIKELLMDELREYEERAKKMSGGKISAGDLETIHKLTDTIKNIDKIEMLEKDDGYSQKNDYIREGNWPDRGNYENSYGNGDYYVDGNSYRGRNRNRMGRYSREGEYSRDNGKHRMIEQLEEMMEESSGREREMIRKCIEDLKNP